MNNANEPFSAALQSSDRLVFTLILLHSSFCLRSGFPRVCVCVCLFDGTSHQGHSQSECMLMLMLILQELPGFPSSQPAQILHRGLPGVEEKEEVGEVGEEEEGVGVSSDGPPGHIKVSGFPFGCFGVAVQ